MADPDLAFENVISGRSAEKRTALIVFPIVVVLALLIVAAAVSISRSSALTTEVQTAKGQLAEANKLVEERDAQLRDARADVAVLSTAGQGAAILTAVKGSGASGLAQVHPERHSLAVFSYNLAPAPDGQEYRAIVTDAQGRATMLGALAPDDRGAAALLARDVPEGSSQLEVALVPKTAERAGAAKHEGAAMPQAAPGQRQAVLAGALPRPGEAGVVMPSTQTAGSRAQARTPGEARRRGR